MLLIEFKLKTFDWLEMLLYLSCHRSYWNSTKYNIVQCTYSSNEGCIWNFKPTVEFVFEAYCDYHLHSVVSARLSSHYCKLDMCVCKSVSCWILVDTSNSSQIEMGINTSQRVWFTAHKSCLSYVRSFNVHITRHNIQHHHLSHLLEFQITTQSAHTHT